MRTVVQKVVHTSVTADGGLLGRAGKEFITLLGVVDGGIAQPARKMADKTRHLGVFKGENGEASLSLAGVKGELLIISQFTLYANYHKGNRPSFTRAGAPQVVGFLYRQFMEWRRQCVDVVEERQSGVSMKVGLLNDRPFILMLDSDDPFKQRDPYD